MFLKRKVECFGLSKVGEKGRLCEKVVFVFSFEKIIWVREGVVRMVCIKVLR